MGANHVAARLAFNNGVMFAAVVFSQQRPPATILFAVIRLQGVLFRFDALTPPTPLRAADRRADRSAEPDYLFLGRAVAGGAGAAGVQHLSALRRVLGSRALRQNGPTARCCWRMPVILFGLALALDVAGAASRPGRRAHWAKIGRCALRTGRRCCSVSR